VTATKIALQHRTKTKYNSRLKQCVCSDNVQHHKSQHVSKCAPLAVTHTQSRSFH